MREFLWRLVQVVLMVVMTAYLPLLWLVSSVALGLQAVQDAVELRLLLLGTGRRAKVRGAGR